MKSSVLLVTNVDISWVNFLPLNPERNYVAEPPPLDQCASEIDGAVQEMIDVVDSKFVFNVHSGTYCRTGFYEEPFLSSYHRAVDHGAELAVHTHEEIAGQGTRNEDEGHVTNVILERKGDLSRAGLTATCFRGGHFAYMNYLTPLLEREGLHIDLSSAPGYDRPDWPAVWTGARLTGHYLCRNDHAAPSCQGEESTIFEIPLGWDGLGTSPQNYLWIEESTLEDLCRVWDSIVSRAQEAREVQVVHVLFHTYSLGVPKFLERYRQFVDYVSRHGAEFATPSEAKRRFDDASLNL